MRFFCTEIKLFLLYFSHPLSAATDGPNRFRQPSRGERDLHKPRQPGLLSNTEQITPGTGQWNYFCSGSLIGYRIFFKHK
jgi:hypothetical protein